MQSAVGLECKTKEAGLTDGGDFIRGTADVQMMTACLSFMASSSSDVTPLVMSAIYSLSDGASKSFSFSKLCKTFTQDFSHLSLLL